MGTPTRWATDTAEGHSQRYVEHVRGLVARGADLDGEARLVDAMLRPGSHVLDAGCGQGRVGAALHARGHRVVGVDADPVLVAAAREDHAGPSWIVADLADMDLSASGVTEPFDGAVMAGNVMAFVAPGSETEVLRRVAAHLLADGFLVVGFGADRGYAVEDFDGHLNDAGFELEHRFGTWDLRPWSTSSDFAVSVLRLTSPDAGRPLEA